MKPFDVQMTTSARKELDRLPNAIIAKIVAAIRDLANDPRPRSSKKLKGVDNTHRLRVGVYRVVYEVHEKEIVILVIRIRHRKDAY